MSDAPDPRTFFRERFPAQLNRSLAEQEQVAQQAQRALDGMRAVAATIRFDVRGAGGGTFFVNVESGRSSAGDTAAQPPFLSIALDRAHYEPLFREAGDNTASASCIARCMSPSTAILPARNASCASSLPSRSSR